MRVNYTTYDVRRNQDSINVRAHPDIMMLAPPGEEGAHPFLYARILRIMHANVRFKGVEHRVDFLWVRWFELDTSRRGGWGKLRLHRLRFADGHDERAFGFVNPSDVIRAVHLIPAFHHGQTMDYLDRSIARRPQDEDQDWKYYYVNM